MFKLQRSCHGTDSMKLTMLRAQLRFRLNCAHLIFKTKGKFEIRLQLQIKQNNLCNRPLALIKLLF